MRKKVFFKLFLIALITSAIVVGVNISLYGLNGGNVSLSNIALSNIEILAQNEGGNANDCPGGYCDYDGRFGSCYACCPEGKSPQCNSVGCTCW